MSLNSYYFHSDRAAYDPGYYEQMTGWLVLPNDEAMFFESDRRYAAERWVRTVPGRDVFDAVHVAPRMTIASGQQIYGRREAARRAKRLTTPGMHTIVMVMFTLIGGELYVSDARKAA